MFANWKGPRIAAKMDIVNGLVGPGCSFSSTLSCALFLDDQHGDHRDMSCTHLIYGEW